MSVFLAYHYPCLDGASAVTMSFLFFREVQKSGITCQDFVEYISQFEDFQSINKSIFKWKDTREKPVQDSPQTFEETKIQYNELGLDEYSPKILKDVEYYPTRINPNGSFYFPYGKYDEAFLKKSVLIFMDYSGGNAENIIEISQKFAKLIILDHHLTAEHSISELKQKDAYPKNLMCLYNVEKSGVTLALEFFEKVKGSPILSDKEKYMRLLEVAKYVEDNDLKADKVKNAEEFTTGLLKRRMNFDPNQNYDLFKDLVEVKPEIVIELGAAEKKMRTIKANKVIKNRHLVFLGGQVKDKQSKEPKGRLGTCYGVWIDEQELRNEVGHLLAEESAKNGLENMGFVYSTSKPAGKMFKISVRSSRDHPGGDCEAISREYNGGGHYHASENGYEGYEHTVGAFYILKYYFMVS